MSVPSYRWCSCLEQNSLMCENDVCMLDGHMPDQCTDPATMGTHEEAPDLEQQDPPVFRVARLWIDESYDDPEGPVHILDIL